jgi:hypothetical protein
MIFVFSHPMKDTFFLDQVCYERHEKKSVFICRFKWLWKTLKCEKYVVLMFSCVHKLIFSWLKSHILFWYIYHFICNLKFIMASTQQRMTILKSKTKQNFLTPWFWFFENGILLNLVKQMYTFDIHNGVNFIEK